MRIGIIIFLMAYGLSAQPAVTAGHPKALPGGHFRIGISDFPSQLLSHLGGDQYSEAISQLVIEPLIELDPDTLAPLPRLASRWSRSPDRLTTTFILDPRARFSDGTQVKAEDVCFTFEAIQSPANQTAWLRSYFAFLKSCRVLSQSKVEFRSKAFHFKSLSLFASLYILPKRFYSSGNFNTAFQTRILGSGPYRLSEVSPGDRIVLTRNETYWGKSLPQNLGRYNFDKLTFKVVGDFSLLHEMFQKGEVDYFHVLSSKMWATEMEGSVYRNGYIQKLKMENLQPFATVGEAWNLRRPLFQDVRVRHALALLFDRQRMIDTLFYKNYLISAGVIPSRSIYHSPKVKPVPFDPVLAAKLLDEAGWTARDSDGVRMKNGKRLEFQLLTNSTGTHRYLTIYQEDLGRVGIKMNIQTLDWVTVTKKVAERDFDGVGIARDREVEPSDFNAMWGTQEASVVGSGNLTGFSSPEIDRLDRQLRETESKATRIKLTHQIEKIIADSHAVAFEWEQTFSRIAYWNRYSFPKNGYFNYSTWNTVFQYWYVDPVKEAKLKLAMEKGSPVL